MAAQKPKMLKIWRKIEIQLLQKKPNDISSNTLLSREDIDTRNNRNRSMSRQLLSSHMVYQIDVLILEVYQVVPIRKKLGRDDVPD